MSKGLEALKNIRREAGFPYFSTFYDSDMWKEDFATVEKELKALEIIKSKGIDIDLLKYHKDLEHYNFSLRGRFEHLTQEEFDLLREVCL